ncbi:MAG TPA: protein kinase, partial [Candidatus Saccharimonadales bacterium]|nr:protein kinase [Candidatus Saccharimonadales bacterium]
MTKTNFSSSFGDDLSPGVRFGGARYVLKRLLGRGENSEVWLAQDVRNSREVALKILPRAFLSDTNLLERLKQETQRNFLLAHPHIAATYEFVRDHSSAAIATEFMDGWSLATLRVDKLCHCYSAEEIQLWICQVCAALDYAHNEFGILHNDLKPANLLINAKDDLKITDFGIAQMIRLESSRRGLAEGVSNSIGFLSPQQVMGGAPSKADDIYSLGATVFDLLTGTPPFHKGEIIAQICSLPPPTMTQRLTELGIQTDPVPPVWEDTVARCLAKNPADRPQNAGEILELLGRKNAVEPARPKTAAPEIETAPAVEPPKAEPSKAVEQEQPHESPPVEMPQEISAPPVAAKKPALPIGAVVVLIALLALGVIGFAGLKLWKLSSASKPEAASLDSGFNPGSGAQGQIRSFAVQPDGKILVGGRFSTFDDQSFNGIVQLYNNGALDVAFAPDPNGMVHAIALESDGHILIGGDFSNIGDAVHHRIARLNADGTVDD